MGCRSGLEEEAGGVGRRLFRGVSRRLLRGVSRRLLRGVSRRLLRMGKTALVSSRQGRQCERSEKLNRLK